MATQANIDLAQKLYVAYYGRPADPRGLTYWADQIETNDVSTVVNAFGSSEEFDARFGDQSNEQLINNLYQQMFGRNAEIDGLNYYADQIDSGAMSLADVALAIANGAQNEDATALQNKVTVASNFTNAIGTTEELLAYQGNDAADAARDFLAGVDASTDVDSVDVDGQLSQLVANADDQQNAGSTFTLTADTNVITGGVDQVTGTAGDDTIRAVLADSLDSTDIIDGGAGNDVLNISDGGFVEDAAPVIKGVERINNANVGTESPALNLAAVTGLGALWTQLDAVSDASANYATYQNGSLDTTYGISGAGEAVASAGINLNFAAEQLSGEDTTLNIALADNADGSIVGAGSTTDPDDLGNLDSRIEHVVVDSQAGNAGTISFGANDSIESVTVTGAGDLEINSISLAGVVTIDASESTGDLTLDLTAADALESVTTGAGNDTIDLSDNTADSVTVTTGEGDDRIVLGANLDNSIDGGEGNDTVVLSDNSFSTQDYDAINGLQNIETLEFSAADVLVDASALDASALTFTGASATVENLGAEQTAIVSAGAEAATAATTQTLNVEGDIADTVNVEASYNASGEEAGDDFSNTVTLTIADDSEVESADTLNLSGNGNIIFANGTVADGAADPVVVAGETFASVDASAMTGALTYSNVAGTKESITLGEDNGADILNVADGSTYGSMDVITNFDSTVDEDADAEGADVTADELTGITGTFTSVDVSDATTLNQAFAAAAGDDNADGGVFFQFEDNTYAFQDSTDGTAGEYDSGDFAIQIVGNHDLSAENAAYAA